MTEQHNEKLMKMSDSLRVPLSTPCLVQLTVAALIATGIFAGLDRVYGGADAVPSAQGNPGASTGSHLYGPPTAEPDRFSKPQTRLVVEAVAEAPPSHAPLEDVGSDGKGLAQSEAQASDAEPASLQGSHSSAPSEVAQDPPGECLFSELRAVLSDVTARFGAVAVVAAHQIKTANHIAGSMREKLHHDCKAIDFRPDPSRVEEIKAYLRSRVEISSIESYRDGVIHMDTGGAPVASRRGPGNSARRQPPIIIPDPSPRTREAPAAFVLLDRDH
jgi:uncharacterized protein YcbK (DUF882 family)